MGTHIYLATDSRKSRNVVAGSADRKAHKILGRLFRVFERSGGKEVSPEDLIVVEFRGEATSPLVLFCVRQDPPHSVQESVLRFLSPGLSVPHSLFDMKVKFRLAGSKIRS